MSMVTMSIRLTLVEKEALDYMAGEEGKSIEEMVGWILHQNIPSILDVMETNPRRDELVRRLIEENS